MGISMEYARKYATHTAGAQRQNLINWTVIQFVASQIKMRQMTCQPRDFQFKGGWRMDRGALWKWLAVRLASAKLLPPKWNLISFWRKTRSVMPAVASYCVKLLVRLKVCCSKMCVQPIFSTFKTILLSDKLQGGKGSGYARSIWLKAKQCCLSLNYIDFCKCVAQL